jgi:hypothetical protein
MIERKNIQDIKKELKKVGLNNLIKNLAGIYHMIRSSWIL